MKYHDSTYWSTFGCYKNNIYLGYNTTESSTLNVYPSPFSSYTTIEFILKEPASVQLRIYNQQGEFIDVIEQSQSAGLNKMIWRPENLSNGMYFLRLIASGQVFSTKVILLRQ